MFNWRRMEGKESNKMYELPSSRTRKETLLPGEGEGERQGEREGERREENVVSTFVDEKEKEIYLS